MFAPVYIAQQEKYFAKHGVDIDLHIFPSGATAIQSLKSAKAGFVAAGDLPSLKIWSDKSAVGVMPITRDTKNVQFIVDSSIKSGQDLKGKKIATVVGSTDQLALLLYLKKLGLSTDDVQIINLTGSAMVPALEKGDIQGFVWIYAVAQKALSVVKGSHLLLDSSDGLLTEQIILNAVQSTLQADPEAVSGLVAALIDGDNLIKSDFKKAAQDVADVLHLPLDAVEDNMKQFEFNPAYDQAFVDAMDSESQAATEYGLTQTAIKTADHFDPSHLKKVDPSLVTAAN